MQVKMNMIASACVRPSHAIMPHAIRAITAAKAASTPINVAPMVVISINPPRGSRGGCSVQIIHHGGTAEKNYFLLISYC
jgi:hypothetical protein